MTTKVSSYIYNLRNVVQTLNVASYIFIPLVSCNKCCTLIYNMDRVKRIWYLSPMRAAKVQASLRIRAVSPEPSLLAHTSSESRGTFRQKARSLAPLNGWACAIKICHDGMLEDTNSLDGAHIIVSHNLKIIIFFNFWHWCLWCLHQHWHTCFLLSTRRQRWMRNKLGTIP